jgi:hypothetical protein
MRCRDCSQLGEIHSILAASWLSGRTRFQQAIRRRPGGPDSLTREPQAREGCGRATLLRTNIGSSNSDFFRDISLSAIRGDRRPLRTGVATANLK